MGPLVPPEAGNAPEHAKRLNGPRGLHVAHVFRFPSKLVQYLLHFSLRTIVVPTDEHRRWTVGEARVDHECIPNTAKRLDKVNGWVGLLQFLHQ